MSTSPSIPVSAISPRHVRWAVDGAVATITLDRPDRRNPLTFDSYDELTRLFRSLVHVREVKAVVLTGAGGNFCSGGDVHDIIGPLVAAKTAGRMDDILRFTTMTGGLVQAMRECPQPIVAAIDGVCAGAGPILAMASDIRLGTPGSRVAFLFTRVGLSGADMGACSLLPRIIGHGRAAELLYTGRFMDAGEAERWGFYNRVVPAETRPINENRSTELGRESMRDAWASAIARSSAGMPADFATKRSAPASRQRRRSSRLSSVENTTIAGGRMQRRAATMRCAAWSSPSVLSVTMTSGGSSPSACSAV